MMKLGHKRVTMQNNSSYIVKKTMQLAGFSTFILLLLTLCAGNVLAGITERISISSSQTEGNNSSYRPSLSSDGRYVAFDSMAGNLVTGDTNGYSDIFVHDRQTGLTQRVSLTSGGVQGNNHSYRPSISSDGRYVAFDSLASNLVTGDTNGYSDIFVHDRQTGLTQRVSLTSGGVQGNNHSYRPSVSSDGRYVTFYTMATNLVSGDTNSASDVFVYDRQTGTLELISISTEGLKSGYLADNLNPSISGDGRNVAFESEANWGLGEPNMNADIFVRNRIAGTTTRVSKAPDGAVANSVSTYPSISIDGRYVTFQSNASNLISGDTNGTVDIFVYDRQSGVTERVNVSTTGVEANYPSQSPSVSRDAAYVAFWSFATNLIPGDANGYSHVYVRDRQAGKTTRMSVSNAGDEGNSGSRYPSMSSDGPLMAFEGTASNLVDGDANGKSDIFIREWGVDADDDGWDVLSDCNDNNSAVNPGAVEVCNGLDDNCDGNIDEGVQNIYYQDSDNDTYGNVLMTAQACTVPSGYVTNASDCNDGNAFVNPGAAEVCNIMDDNCNGQTDEGLSSTYFADSDSDTYGDASVITQACMQPSGYVTDNTDCDDTSYSINPGAVEIPDDGIDQDCSGSDLTTSKLSNISTRGMVQTGDSVMIGGFIISGTAPRSVLIRGFGPTLADWGVSGSMSNPYIELYSGQTLIATNDNWQTPIAQCDAPAVSCGIPQDIQTTGKDACTVATTGCSQDAAILVTLTPGAYTVIMRGVGGGTGVGLISVDDNDTNTLSKLVNISTRGPVLTGDSVMIGGFIVGVSSSKQVLIRGFGPTLSDFGVPGAMSNPYVELYSGQTLIATNDNWQTPIAQCDAPAVSCGTPQDIQATGKDACTVATTGCSQDASILVTLPPGAYTAIMRGVSGGTGVGLVGIDEIGP